MDTSWTTLCDHVTVAWVMVMSVWRISSAGNLTEVCQTEKFEARCSGADEVIVLEEAYYGRRERYSRCVDRDYGYIGCDGDVLLQADTLCSGRRQCSIAIPEPLFDATEPCPNDLKSYFSARYSCMKVIPAPNVACLSTPQVELTGQSGAIASIVTMETDLGSNSCPWVIQVKPGQQVNVTLLDFSAFTETSSGCQAYAVFRERPEGRPVQTETVCHERRRQGHVYVSKGNRLEIRVVKRLGDGDRHFVLKYQAIGCPDPEAPEGGHVTRRNSLATFSCERSDMKWERVCANSTWRGPNHNCTKGGTAQGVFGDVSWGDHKMPFGSSMIIVVAIALSLGVVILVIGLSILKCKRRTLQHQGGPSLPPHQYQTTYKVPGVSPDRPVPVHTESDTYYQAPENEYAYISDFPTHDPSQAQNLSNRHMELYKARNCYDYGTAANQPNLASPRGGGGVNRQGAPQGDHVQQASKSKPQTEVQDRHVEKNDRRLVDGVLPTYFELDPDDPNPGSGKGEYKKMIVNNNCSLGAHGVEPAPITRSNQSSYNFNPSPYDHLVDSGGNDSHKSV